MDPIQIPDKTYFKIGEVAKLLDLQPYVLRYWETEFDVLKPEKTKSGQRAYRRVDIELLFLIKTLLYDEMYTIAGACRQLKLRKKGAIEPLGPEAQQRLVDSHGTLSEEKQAWTVERERLTLAAEKHREEAGRLRIQNETLEDENAQLAAAQLEYESSIRRLRDEVTQRRNTVETLEQRVEEMSGESSARSDQLELQVQNTENVERIAELEQERTDLVTKMEQATAQLDAESDRVASLQAKLSEAEQAVEAIRAEKSRIVLDAEGLEADLASAESELERLEAEKAELAAQVVDTSTVDALEARLREAMSNVESLQAERDVVVARRQQHDDRQRVHYLTLRKELQSLAALVN